MDKDLKPIKDSNEIHNATPLPPVPSQTAKTSPSTIPLENDGVQQIDINETAQVSPRAASMHIRNLKLADRQMVLAERAQMEASIAALEQQIQASRLARNKHTEQVRLNMHKTKEEARLAKKQRQVEAIEQRRTFAIQRKNTLLAAQESRKKSLLIENEMRIKRQEATTEIRQARRRLWKEITKLWSEAWINWRKTASDAREAKAKMHAEVAAMRKARQDERLQNRNFLLESKTAMLAEQRQQKAHIAAAKAERRRTAMQKVIASKQEEDRLLRERQKIWTRFLNTRNTRRSAQREQAQKQSELVSQSNKEINKLVEDSGREIEAMRKTFDRDKHEEVAPQVASLQVPSVVVNEITQLSSMSLGNGKSDDIFHDDMAEKYINSLRGFEKRGVKQLTAINHTISQQKIDAFATSKRYKKQVLTYERFFTNQNFVSLTDLVRNAVMVAHSTYFDVERVKRKVQAMQMALLLGYSLPIGHQYQIVPSNRGINRPFVLSNIDESKTMRFAVDQLFDEKTLKVLDSLIAQKLANGIAIMVLNGLMVIVEDQTVALAFWPNVLV